MKKTLKAIILFLLLIISFIATNVMAEGGKTITIELPSNYENANNIDLYMYSNFTLKQAFAFDLLLPIFEQDPNYIYNQDGKPIIKINNKHLELLDGVTEEDCTYDITDEMKEKIHNNTGYLNFFKEYDKIKLVLIENYEFKFDDTYIINLTNMFPDNFFDIKFFDNLLLEETLPSIDSLHVRETISNRNGKELITLQFPLNITSETPTDLQTFIPSDLTEEDDIIIELTEDEIENLKSYLKCEQHNTASYCLLDNYSRLIIEFSNKEYLDSDYVVDMKTLNLDNFAVLVNYLNYVFEKKKIVDLTGFLYFKNDEGKNIFEIEIMSIQSEISENNYIAIISPDVTYRDYIVYDLPEELRNEIRQSLKTEPMKKIVIMVKNPEFLEGQNQTFYKNNKDDISFVLTIDKDELDEGGSVYIDGNLVDKNNYVLDSNVKGVTLTLKKEYLDTLDKGNHEIKVKALYGEVLSAFKVEKNILNPETGNKITIMFILMFICIESIIIYKRKMKKLA